ncbi:MAG: hypothetical protein LBE84_08770 [Planctomycetota bacterium]|nr:hypothetical protein [Planctomycetota bacterium]
MSDAGTCWRERRPGRVLSRRIFENGGEPYGVVVESAFSDGSRMSLRLAGTETGAWRLASAFP